MKGEIKIRNPFDSKEPPISAFEQKLERHSMERLDDLAEKIFQTVGRFPNLKKTVFSLTTKGSKEIETWDEGAYFERIHESKKPATPITKETWRMIENEILQRAEELDRLFPYATLWRDKGGLLRLHGVESDAKEGEPIRKAYVNPPVADLPIFFGMLSRVIKENRIGITDAKIHPDALQWKDGHVEQQEHNLLCFYFKDDAQFIRFLDGVSEAEQRSRVTLNRYSNLEMPKYGRNRNGSVLFGVDLPGNGNTFDGWSQNLISAGLDVALERGKKTEISQAIEASLKDQRGVDVKRYLSLRKP